MKLRHRPWTVLLALLAAFALVATACGDDDDDGDDSSQTTVDGGGDGAVASDIVLGGPPECPTNPGCIPGLRALYGVDLEPEFVSLDGGGPLTAEALRGGEIDIAVFFSTNPLVTEEGWVVLDDPEGLVKADNIVPVLSSELEEAYGDAFVALVNEVSATLDTEELTELNRLVDIELEDASDAAADWLEANGLLDGNGEPAGDGPTITIGAQDFSESAILAQVYGQALEAGGYPVAYQSLGGYRDVVFSSFESGDINFTLEYAASALEFLNELAGEATADAEETTELLRGHLADRGLVALDPSSAVDQNIFVMTPERSGELGITSLADLAG